jgi:hypothetical protein
MDFDLAAGREVLARTPQVMRVLLEGLPPGWTEANEGPDTFSPFDVVGHLIGGEETDWIPRARIILAQGAARTFAPFDRIGHRERNRGRSLGALLDRFAELRAGNLAALEGMALAPAHLALLGEHPSLGTVTLGQLLATWVVHDLGHVAQATRVMAKQYRTEVGPWRAYLPVLQR